ncbi:MAG: FAD-binding oxidoreductase [Xenococcaceae cyanobacterium MO_167.B27]|nr:FAD-binding oxidoreductase [Xenococcaceae cyanobacterium MO_167.B27]
MSDELLTNLAAKTALVKFTELSPDWQNKITEYVTSDPNLICGVFPDTVETLASVVEAANAKGWCIIPCGNGSKLDWGGLTDNIKLVVSTIKCDRILEHAVGDLTVTVEAGVKLVDLQATLAATNQFLPIDPAYPQQATIGGIVATADTGSLRNRYGGIRDLILGLSFVRADGKIAKAGGRVVKNVAGYDLMKLFTGSYGTLGIITQVTFRTYPLPQASQTILVIGEEKKIQQLIQSLRNSGLTPVAADVVSASVMKQLSVGEDIGLLVRFQTIPESITEQSRQLKSMMQPLGLQGIEYSEQDEEKLWHQLSEIIRIPHSTTAIICKLGLLPTQAVNLLNELNDHTWGRIHIGSGLGELQLLNEELENLSKMRSHCEIHQGFLSILTAPKSVKQKIESWGYTGNTVNLMKTIKQKFDPNQIFKPNSFVNKI